MLTGKSCVYIVRVTRLLDSTGGQGTRDGNASPLITGKIVRASNDGNMLDLKWLHPTYFHAMEVSKILQD